MGNPSTMHERKPQASIEAGELGRGCQSVTWQKTQVRPRAGNDGGGRSPWSAQRDSYGAAGPGGRIAVTRAP